MPIKNIGTVYNITNGLQLEGHANKNKISQCIQELVDRHEPLRTSFHVIDGIARQKIHKDCIANVEIFEAENDDQEVVTIINNFIRPFDLSKKSQFRVGLIHVGVDKSILIFDLHHIICDGVTISTLADEFTQLYADAQLEPLNIQHKDYIAFLDQNNKVGAEEFWLNQLNAPIPVLDLPTDFSRNRRVFEGAQYSFEIDGSLIKKLSNSSDDASVTLYIKLMSVVYILLSKYTKQEDVIIGSGVAGRSHPDVSKTIGLFFNAFPVRIKESSAISFTQLMDKVKELMLNIYDYEGCDMEKVYKELQLSRNPERNFLYDIVFLLQNYQASGIDIEDVAIEHYALSTKYSQNDITFHAYQLEDGLKMVLTYCTQLFKKETINRMGSNFEYIINK